jgi:hypothetical protein
MIYIDITGISRRIRVLESSRFAMLVYYSTVISYNAKIVPVLAIDSSETAFSRAVGLVCYYNVYQPRHGHYVASATGALEWFIFATFPCLQ